MLNRHWPLVYGLLVVITFLSAITVIYHLLGADKGEALYLACLTFAVLFYVRGRRLLRRSGGK
jgi:hypothetical protein